jgi:hypothetical protein
MKYSELKSGESYLWTMGAEMLVIDYIGKTAALPEIKPSTKIGNGFIFQFEKGDYMEIGYATLLKYVDTLEDTVSQKSPF